MAKTQEELNIIKEEVKALNEKLAELTDEELAQVTGGLLPKDHYENVILKNENQQNASVQTYPKDIGSDKNAKVIFN